ncbi:MAG: branched-chain amino acid ABC transporter permease [Acidimicrobiia bacterium]|nr:branched-chain amino acid ABC transporter permease [Acidimicrobiia bacterium]
MMFALDVGKVMQETLTQAFGPQAVVFAMAAIGLNIHFGYTGLLNFGHIGFLAAGAYGTAIAITSWSINPVLAIGFGIIFALVLALILGVPTLRLRADYLAIVTIAAAEILRLLARSTALRSVTRGAEGLNEWAGGYQDANPFSSIIEVGPFRYLPMQFAIVVFGWLAVAIVSGLVWLIMRSPWGRVLKAIREDEDAARALGKNAYSFKMQALLLGGAIGGFAGFIQVLDKATVQPDTFVPPITFFIWTVLILGGAARVFSPVVGAIIFWFVIVFSESLLSELVADGTVPSSILESTQVSNVRFLIMGLMLMGLMVFRPQGIFGDREEMALDDR